MSHNSIFVARVSNTSPLWRGKNITISLNPEDIKVSHDKMNSEFFVSATDGQKMWIAYRYLNVDPAVRKEVNAAIEATNKKKSHAEKKPCTARVSQLSFK